MYFLLGRLPWQSLPANTKKAKYRKIMEKKIEVPLEDLCDGYPGAFFDYLLYCRELKYEEVPNYSYCMNLFS